MADSHLLLKHSIDHICSIGKWDKYLIAFVYQTAMFLQL